jgi:hypothetical protein
MHLPSFDRHFLERSPLFWPIARAARAVLTARAAAPPPGLEALSVSHVGEDFPPVEALERVFEGNPPVRFALAPPRPRRRRAGPVDVGTLYDARIAVDRVVPTRARSWHDLMNAFVWGTFPRAKTALHARQHRAIAARIEPGARRLPAVRTRELDALALLDEGGVAVLARDPNALREALRADARSSLAIHVASGVAQAVVFGHAIYESLALGVAPAVPPPVVAAIVLGPWDGVALAIDEIDERLARAIEDPARLKTPEELTRVTLPTSTGQPVWATHAAPR